MIKNGGIMSAAAADELANIKLAQAPEAKRVDMPVEGLEAGLKQEKEESQRAFRIGLAAPAAFGATTIGGGTALRALGGAKGRAIGKALRTGGALGMIPGVPVMGISALGLSEVKKNHPTRMLAAKALQGGELSKAEIDQMVKNNPSGSHVKHVMLRADHLTDGKQRKNIIENMKPVVEAYQEASKRKLRGEKTASSKQQAQLADEAFKLLRSRFPDMPVGEVAHRASQLGREGRPGVLRRLWNAVEAPGPAAEPGAPIMTGGKEYRRRFAAEMKRTTPGKQSIEESVRANPDVWDPVKDAPRSSLGRARQNQRRGQAAELGPSGAIPAAAPA